MYPYYYNNPYNPYNNSNNSYNPNPYSSNSLNGRIVTSVDEVRAAQIALDGSVSYFPSPAENKVYTKSVGLNGLPVVKTYIIPQEPETNTKTEVKTEVKNEVNTAIGNLLKRIETIESTLKEIRNEPVESFTAI